MINTIKNFDMGKKTVIVVVIILIVFYIVYKVFFANATGAVIDIGDKFGISGRGVDQGTYQNSFGEISGEVIEKFNAMHVESSKNSEKLYLVFGDANEVYLADYQEINKGGVSLLTGRSIQKVNVNEEEYTSKKLVVKDNKVSVLINGKEYEFALSDGEGLYIIIAENEKGETRVL